MKLIDAVNLIMPKLGERAVTSLQQKHPTLAVLLPIFESNLTSTLLEGWWFNEYIYEAPVSPNGTVTLGAQTLKFLSLDDPTIVLRGQELFNTRTQSNIFTEPVRGRIVVAVPFDELPETVAQYVYWSTLLEATVTDLGVTDEVKLWMGQVQAAHSQMLAEHLRNKRYNTQNTRAYRKYRNALRS